MATSITAPTLDDFEVMARDAMASLPAHFTDRVSDVAFVICDFPDDDICAEMDLESPFDILGLYSGMPFGEKELAGTPGDLDRIHLFRRPILDYWCETGDDLAKIIQHVLVHEIGHHFGLSDEDMERIERQAGSADGGRDGRYANLTQQFPSGPKLATID